MFLSEPIFFEIPIYRCNSKQHSLEYKSYCNKVLNKIDKSNLTFSQKVKTSILSNFLDYSLNELFEYKNELLGKVNIQDVTSIDDIFNSFGASVKTNGNI